MSNGYLVAAGADAAAAYELGDGFGLDVIEADLITNHDAVSAKLAQAANVGLVLSNAAAEDRTFVALVQVLATRLNGAQLIVAEPEARAKFAFLPEAWPAMSLADARTRASALARQRQPETQAPTHAHPLPPAEPEPPREPAVDATPEPASESADEPALADETPAEETQSDTTEEIAEADAPSENERGITLDDEKNQDRDDGLLGGVGGSVEQEREESFGGEAPIPASPPSVEPPAPPTDLAPQAPAPVQATPPPQTTPPAVPAPAEPPRTEAPELARKRSAPPAGAAATTSAPADATAFAPKKLRRETPELVRIVVHQPKDLQAVIKAAKKIDPRTDPAPQGMPIGDVAIGAKIGVSLEVRGAACDGALQRRTWTGEPIDFSYSVEADSAVKQVVFLARIFVDDAQIGVLAFTRNVSGPAKKPHSEGDRIRLKRHKRVFLSYSSKDRETVSAIATAYASAGVEHFWDRTSLKSGEEWHPRLRREIDRADLFHVCWSKNAADSEWVKKETEHALTRRRRNSGRPEITVQMLDGPPWAPHPPELDAINFDDFVRAAIVGYARGDGSE